MTKRLFLNLLDVATGHTGTITSATNNLCFSDWTNQSQNATQGVLRWLYCLSPKQDAI